MALALTWAAGAAAAPRGFVGMTSEDSYAGDAAYSLRQLRAQRRAGVQLLRQTFDWSQIEYRRGAYDWTLHDRLVISAARSGIAVMPVLFNAPPWRASGRSRRGTYPPRSPAAMARFAAAAVAQYGPRGKLWRNNPGVRPRPIRTWQVWNEPTLPVYWGGRPDAGAYVRLLKAVTGAIKRRDGRAEVLTAGLPPSVLRGAVPLLRYIDQIYRAGGRRYFDTLAVNSYSRNSGELGRLLEGVRRLMNRRGDRRARIWITELGWCDRGPRHRFCVGAGNQARLTRSSIALIRRNTRRLGLRGFVYYSWRDGRPYPPDFKDFWGLHTGLLRRDGSAKPALSAFRRAVGGLR